MLQNALWLTLSELLLRAVAMLFQVYLSNRMGAAGVGLLQLVLTVTGLSATLALAGAKVTAMNLTARAAGLDDAAGVRRAVTVCLRYALCTGGAAALLLYGLSAPLARFFVQDPAALPSLRAFALLLPAGCLTAVLSGYCTACGRVRRLVCVALLERIVSIGLTVALLVRAADDPARTLLAVVGGAAAAPVLSLALLYGFYRRDAARRPPAAGRPAPLFPPSAKRFPAKLRRPEVRPPYGRNKTADRADRDAACAKTQNRLRKGAHGPPSLRTLLHTAVPLAVGDDLRAALNAVEQFLIPWGLAQSGSRYTALAAYGTIVGMVFPILLFPAAILHALADLLVPELSRCAVRGRLERIRSLTERCLRGGALFAAAVWGVIFCAAEGLGELFYHSAEAGYYLRLLSPMILFLYLDAVVDGMQKGLGQQVYTVRYNTLTNVIDVVGLFTLLPRFGIGGYLFTYALSHLVNFFLSLRRLLTVADAAPRVASLGRLLCGALAAAALSLLLPTPGLFSGLALRAGSYLLLFTGLILLPAKNRRIMETRNCPSREIPLLPRSVEN